MKKLVTIICALVVLTMEATAQSNPNADAIRNSLPYCPNLFNPTQFNIQGSNPAYASWTGFGGTKTGQASSVGSWGGTYTNTATAVQIDQATATGSNTWIYSGESCTQGNESANNDYKRRFKIMSAGTDDLTGNHLSKVPTDPDTTFVRSIRLGNRCGGTGAEKLQYQFKVTPQNALLVLYYALSLQNGQHDAANNPEFVIEVQVGTPNATTQASNLNTYSYSPVGNTLFFVRPTPTTSASDVSPFYVGSTGTHTGASYGCNVYLPWNKVVINLGQYLNQPVRVNIGAGDCAYSAHYAYAYFAGYCRPMKITVDGCPTGNTTAVSTLHAPAGIEDPTYTADPNYHAYQWYISNSPDISAENIGMSYSDADFAANFTAIPGANSSSYETNVNHFMMGGTLRESRAFACVMTTFMNQTTGANGHRTYPITSRLFADATNQKPQVNFEYDAYCDGRIELNNKSFCGVTGYMVDSLVSWKMYPNQACLGVPLTQATGWDATIQTDAAATYYVKMHVPTRDSSCYNDIVLPVTSIENPHPSIFASKTDPCLGEDIVLRDETNYVTTGGTCTWSFSDSTQDNGTTVTRSFTLANDTVRLHVESTSQEPISATSTDMRNCSADTFIVINVFTSPNLTVSDDTIVCEGQRTNVTVNVDDDDPTATYEYEWYRRIGGTPLNNPGGNVLQQVPDAGSETSKYYVKVTRQPQGCEAWDSVTVHVVRPTLKMLPADGKMCPGEQITLVGGNAHHYSWTASPADASLDGQDEKDTIVVSPSRTTSYTLVGHGSDNCDADPLHATVTVYQTPIPALTYNPDFVDSEDPVVTFRDNSQYGETARWDFGGGESATGRQVSHTFNSLGNDSVHVTMTSYNALGNRAPGCFADTSIAIPIQLFSVWYPNMFTPNLENNRTFRIVTANDLEAFHIFIYDRRGQLIFESQDQNFEWDGTYNGIECPQAAYVYLIRYRRPGTSVVVTKKGTVTLIR